MKSKQKPSIYPLKANKQNVKATQQFVESAGSECKGSPNNVYV